MSTSDIAQKARNFAAGAHAAVKQVRKYNGKPYIEHPERVAALVELHDPSPLLQAVAYLHDVIEDTGVTYDDVYREFGRPIADMVRELTNVTTAADGNRATRKAIEREHLAKASPGAKTVKLADLIDNTDDIVANDKAFAKVYLAEKAALLEVLREGNATLWRLAKLQLDTAIQALLTKPQETVNDAS